MDEPTYDRRYATMFDLFGKQSKLIIMSIQPAHARPRASIPIPLAELPRQDYRWITGRLPSQRIDSSASTWRRIGFRLRDQRHAVEQDEQRPYESHWNRGILV